jgi:aryl-alcohol dehydrogenase-like predicted oxidoreductase
MVWSPLAGGLLSGKFGPGAPGEGDGRRANFDFPPVNLDRAWECVAAMRKVAQKHGTSVATVALAWVLSKSFVTSVIIGAKGIEQLSENLAATKLALDADDLQALDAVSELSAEYPGWMLDLQGVTRIPAPFVGNI